MCTAYFDGGVSAHRGVGSYMCFDENGDLAFAQGTWFGEQCPTNKKCCGNEALLMLMQSLVEHGVPGQAGTVLVIRDSQLIINFANCIARPSKGKMFLGVRKLRKLEKCLSARIVYQQVLHKENKIADWLCNVEIQLQRGVDLAAVAPKLVLGDLPLWRAEESSKHIHNCIGVGGACLCTVSLLESVSRAVVGSSFPEASK